MKLKKADLFTKIVIAALIVYALVTLVSLRRQLNTELVEQDAVQSQIDELEQENQQMQYAIDHRYDEETIASIAREDPGYIGSDEIIFRDVSD